jgi:hypothetical protein
MIFRHIVTVYPVTLGESVLGGITQDHAAVGTTYRAFVQLRNESLDIINQTGGVRTGAVVYVLGSCIAKPLDRLVYAGKTYEITAAMPQRTPDTIQHTKLMVVELDQVP